MTVGCSLVATGSPRSRGVGEATPQTLEPVLVPFNLLPMSPNDCYPCPRSKEKQAGPPSGPSTNASEFRLEGVMARISPGSIVRILNLLSSLPRIAT